MLVCKKSSAKNQKNLRFLKNEKLKNKCNRVFGMIAHNFVLFLVIVSFPFF